MMATKILLIEDDPALGENLSSVLSGKGHEVSRIDNGFALLEAVGRSERPDIVLLNYVLPAAPGSPPANIGLILLRFIKQAWPQSEVIMFTGWVGPEVAFQAGKLGAFDYILKSPNLDSGKLNEVLQLAVEHRMGRKPKSPANLSQSEVLALMQESEHEFVSNEGQDTSFTFLEGIERDAIIQMLRDTGGNKFETAKRLGIGRQTLYNKIKAYGIEVRSVRPAPKPADPAAP